MSQFENPPVEQLYANRWRIWGVVMIGLFMALIDVTIVNISIPQLERDLNASVDTVSWVLNAYNIMFAVLLVSMGRLADQFGRKRFFLMGMSIFTVGSLLCALSWSVGALIAFRIVQAIGAAILAPLALATTALVFPPQQRGFGLAMMAVVANVAAAIGPPVGGVLVELAGWPWDVGWHWIFMINVPIGVLGIALALRVMPETRDPHAGTEVDWWGMATIGGAVFCLTFGLVEANNRGWGSSLIVTLFVASALLTGAFALSQRNGRYPMLTRALARNRQFMGASASLLLFAVGMMGTLFMTVLVFVNLWGYSELEAALAVTPVPVMAMIVSPLVGRFSTRLPPRVFGVPALVVMAGGLWALSGLPAEPSLGRAIWPLALVGLGVGATFPAVSIGSMGSVRGQELGLASGIVNMSRQVGFAIGIALLVAVFTGTVDDQLRDARREVAALPEPSCRPPECRRAVSFSSEAGETRLELEFFGTRTGAPQPKPGPSLVRRADKVVDQHVRDAYGAAFRVAALVTLLAIPFSLTMRRRPTDVVAAEAPAAAG
jgi:EmrB/QacA subfamily drug resistance transporter